MDQADRKTKMIAFDMNGIFFWYTDKKGVIELVEEGIDEQGLWRNQEIFEAGTREYHQQHPEKFKPGYFDLIEDNALYQLMVEGEMVKDLFSGNTDVPFGLALNYHAARFFLEAKDQGYKPFIVSSSDIITSQRILAETLALYIKAEEVADPAHRDIFPGLVVRQETPVYNMAEFGSKKDCNAWEHVFCKAMLSNFGHDADLALIVEDDKEKMFEAVKGAGTLGYKPKYLNEITTETQVSMLRE